MFKSGSSAFLSYSILGSGLSTGSICVESFDYIDGLLILRGLINFFDDASLSKFGLEYFFKSTGKFSSLLRFFLEFFDNAKTFLLPLNLFLIF